MPTRLTLISHAATAATRAAAFPSDEAAIEDGGAELASALASRLRRPDRVWTSPALAARQTAVALGLAAQVEGVLRDCDYGRWTGRTLADVQAEDPRGLAAWLADLDVAPHGGESLSTLCERVAAWLRDRVGEGGHTVAVTHASVMRAAVRVVLDAPAATFWRIDVEPLSLIELRSDGKRWNLRSSAA